MPLLESAHGQAGPSGREAADRSTDSLGPSGSAGELVQRDGHASRASRGVREPARSVRRIKVIERFTRVDRDTIDYTFTIDDPTMFTRPWTGRLPLVNLKSEVLNFTFSL